MSRPGAYSNLWRTIVESFAKRKKVVVGSDHFGNVYYEEATRGKGRVMKSVARGFVPGPHSSYKTLPVEWDAWIKGTRKYPPTEAEILANIHKQQAQSSVDARTEAFAPKLKTKEPTPSSPLGSYPTYEEGFEKAPGAVEDEGRHSVPDHGVPGGGDSAKPKR